MVALDLGMRGILSRLVRIKVRQDAARSESQEGSPAQKGVGSCVSRQVVVP